MTSSMDRVRNFFGFETDSSEVPNSTVLAEWNKYSTNHDVESGTPEPTSSLFLTTLNDYSKSFTSALSTTQETIQE